MLRFSWYCHSWHYPGRYTWRRSYMCLIYFGRSISLGYSLIPLILIFISVNWNSVAGRSFNGEVEEYISINYPYHCSEELYFRMSVDSDHAGDKNTRVSQHGFIILNTALIWLFSNNQATIETSLFVAEFVEMKIGMEMLCGFRYKLSMIGVYISFPLYI